MSRSSSVFICCARFVTLSPWACSFSRSWILYSGELQALCHESTFEVMSYPLSLFPNFCSCVFIVVRAVTCVFDSIFVWISVWLVWAKYCYWCLDIGFDLCCEKCNLCHELTALVTTQVLYILSHVPCGEIQYLLE